MRLDQRPEIVLNEDALHRRFCQNVTVAGEREIANRDRDFIGLQCGELQGKVLISLFFIGDEWG